MARPAARFPLTSIWKFDTTCCMTGTWLSDSRNHPTTSARPPAGPRVDENPLDVQLVKGGTFAGHGLSLRWHTQ
jgi:hypothetical protein